MSAQQNAPAAASNDNRGNPNHTKAKNPRYRCRDCRATFTEPKPTPLGTHTTSLDDAVKVFTLMTEGMSVRAISRVTCIHKTTILALLLTVGLKCARLFDAKVQNVRPRYVQADEAWTFVQKKQKRLTVSDPVERGDQYVWIALDSETKAVLSYYVGKRDGFSAYEFIGDLRQRVAENHRCRSRLTDSKATSPPSRNTSARMWTSRSS